jgi:uncharacterized lipoprotein YmbA
MTRVLHALAVVLLLGGCASTPVTLVTLPAAPWTDVVPRAGASVMLREVRVPGYLEGFPIVLGRDGSGLVVSRDAEWAERLGLGATRVLRDSLAQHLGTSRVVIESDGRMPDAELAIEFLALDPRDGALQLDARWYFSCTRGGGRGDRTRLRVPLAGATPSAVAQATGTALARFGALLAGELPCAAQDVVAPKAGTLADDLRKPRR